MAILNPGENQVLFEVQHLVRNIDNDGDGRLQKEEVLNNYYHFFKSQATNWGASLLNHEEL